MGGLRQEEEQNNEPARTARKTRPVVMKCSARTCVPEIPGSLVQRPVRPHSFPTPVHLSLSQMSMQPRHIVIDLVNDSDGVWQEPWLRVCALYAAPVLEGDRARGLAEPWVDDPDPAVSETARWVLARDRD